MKVKKQKFAFLDILKTYFWKHAPPSQVMMSFLKLAARNAASLYGQ
jgi:hypothetical protein